MRFNYRHPKHRTLSRSPDSFDETEHPRGEDGKFAKSPGSGKNQESSPAEHEASRVPTRFMKKSKDPNAKSADNIIDTEAMKLKPALFEHNVNLTRNYVNMPKSLDNASTEEVAAHFVKHVKDNLLWLHDNVPAETRQRSKLWYDGARKITDDLAGKYKVAPESVAAAIAALSPKRDWYQNVELAKRVIDIHETKKDFRTDAAMEDTMARIYTEDKAPLQDALRGKTYGELTDITERAAWVRAYMESHTPKAFPMLSPEGEVLGNKKTQSGEDWNIAPASFSQFGNAILALDAKGDIGKISPTVGQAHKVRNFYNNIIAPNSNKGDVTMDTHAVAAGLLRPLSANDTEVAHNLGTTPPKGTPAAKDSDTHGVSGLYGIYADAYRQAAAERGIKPREMQSITWEAVRGLFKDKFKANKNNTKAVDAMWQDYRDGKASLDETRSKILAAAKGIEPPTWHPDHPDNKKA